jgi:hypothetical protein
MDRERLRLWAKPGVLSLPLLTLFLVCQFVHALANGPVLLAFQASGERSAATAPGANGGIQGQYATQGSPNPVQPSDLAASKSQLAPPARPWPFRRLAAILLA